MTTVTTAEKPVQSQGSESQPGFTTADSLLAAEMHRKLDELELTALSVRDQISDVRCTLRQLAAD